MAKFATVEEAKEMLDTTKEELKVAKAELKEMKKTMGVKGEDIPENPKDAKRLSRQVALIEKKEKAIEEATAFVKEKKPKKSAAPREFKYAYPADCETADQKKKFRSEARAAAKRAAKAALNPKKDKKAKAEEVAAPAAKKAKKAPVEEAASAKKKKKTPAAED